MISGIAKLFPIWAFEKQMVDLGITSWYVAPYLARLIIAFEIAIGISILQPHFLKRIVIPATIFMLVAFCVHLSIEMFKRGAMNGNCGCFGQLIPMTPLEAFIKNIITIGLLVYLFFNVSEKEKGRNKFIYLVLIYLASALMMFMFFPFCPYKSPGDEMPAPQSAGYTTLPGNSSDTNQKELPLTSVNNASGGNKEGVQTPPVTNEIKGPNFVTSKFSRFTTFGNQVVDLDDGRKLLCFFVPGCDECRVTARQLDSLSKKIDLPPVYVIFMNEETNKIPEFFRESKCNYPYTILEVPAFWELMGVSANTPGVFYLWNGNVIRFYEGVEFNKFNPSNLKQALAE
jgi:uncharacterized membrane protein YphA (DoxX/SURF4 family)